MVQTPESELTMAPENRCASLSVPASRGVKALSGYVVCSEVPWHQIVSSSGAAAVILGNIMTAIEVLGTGGAD